MILDKLTVKNTTIFVFLKLFIYNFSLDLYFRHQIMALFISMVFIGFAWLLIWIYVLQRFKIFREILNEFVIK